MRLLELTIGEKYTPRRYEVRGCIDDPERGIVSALWVLTPKEILEFVRRYKPHFVHRSGRTYRRPSAGSPVKTAVQEHKP